MISKAALFPIVLLLCGAMSLGADLPQAAAPLTPKRGGVLRLDDSSDIRSLDPIAIYDALEGILACMLYRPLLDYDSNEQIIPMLAESLPKISADGLTYTFALRHGVRFSNGREVVADDWVYSLERHLDPRNQPSYAPYYLNIAGAAAFQGARAKEQAAGADLPTAARTIEPKTVEGLRAVDRYTLQIRLEKPDLVFSDVLATPMSAAVPREAVEHFGKEFGSHPVGAGPFVLGQWKRGIHIRMDRNLNYFRPGEPYLEHVDVAFGPDPATEIMMFERGELDYVGSVSTPDFLRLERSPLLRPCMSGIVGGDALYISLNCEMPPFADVRVRRAMNYAVDKQRVLKVLLNRGVIAHGLLVPFVKGYTDTLSPYPYDPAKARALLAEAGYANGFETQLTVASDALDEMKVALVIERDLSAVGVKMHLNKVQGQAVYIGQKRHAIPMEFWDWVPNFNDPKDTLDFLTNGERITDDTCINTAFYSNAEVNQLFHQGAGELDPGKRLKVYQRIEQHVLEDAPYLFLVHMNVYELHQPWLKGVKARGIWPRRLENAWIDR